jgi:hypothetical protein
VDGGSRDGFAIAVPTGRPINPVTKTSWEGVGVEPDVKVPADNALNVAHAMALEQQQWTIPAEAAGLRNEVSTALSRLRGVLSAASLSIPSSSSEEAVAASVANDDFESGALTKWRIDRKGPGGWFVYRNGSTPPSLAVTDPGFPFAVPAPPQGTFAALTDMNGPGRFILSRKVTLDGRYRLRMTVFYANSGRFSADDIESRCHQRGTTVPSRSRCGRRPCRHDGRRSRADDDFSDQAWGPSSPGSD